MSNVLQLNRLQNVEQVVSALEQLLADYQVYYTNLRGFHWNVQGHAFFHLHEAFEKKYDSVADKVDEIAERILQLGGTPTARFSDYLKVARIQEAGVEHSGCACVKNIIETTAFLLDEQRKIVKLAGEVGDDTTVALLGDYIREQEKEIWMLAAFTADAESCCKG